MKNVIPTLLTGALLPFAAPLAFAQAAEQDDDIFELSPFTVDGNENEGYRATNTLAGTRIRTELKDIGTSIQVITKDFLNDIGAQDAQDLLNYTTSTEVGGISGNYSGENADSPELNSAGSRANPQSSTRVRGLFQADNTRNYFKSVIPFDTYNTSSVDINRGSNATLFGLGSPAGIINNTLEAASWKDGGEFTLRMDSEGSVRASLNINKVLLEDRLAFRAAVLEDDREYYQNPAYQDSRRFYGAITAKITETAMLRANFESGKVRSNRPDSMAPLESLSPWFTYGKPVYDSSLATGIGRSLNAPTGIQVDKNGDGILDDVFPAELVASDIYTYMQYPDGSFANAGNFSWNNNTKTVTGPKLPSYPGAEKNGDGGFINSGAFNQIILPFLGNAPGQAGFVAEPPANYFAAGDALSLTGDGQVIENKWLGTPNYSDFFNFHRAQGYLDFSGFDWGKNLLEGSTSEQRNDFSAYNLTLEKTFWEKKAGVEISLDHQSFDMTSYTPMQFRNGSDLQVDINARLPDGSVNPNFGRPFAISRNGRSYRSEELETLRATGFIQHDFREQFDGIGKWFGKHTLTGTLDRNEQATDSWGSSLIWDDEDIHRILDVVGGINQFNNNVVQTVYLGPSILGSDVQSLSDVVLTPPTNLNLWNPGASVPVTYWDPGIDPSTGKASIDPDFIKANGQLVTRDVRIREGVGNGVTHSNTVTKSKAAVWQSYFLENHIVGTIGYRKDEVADTTYKNPPVDHQGVSLLGQPLSTWGDAIPSGTEADRWSYGAVAHIPAKWTPWQDTQLSLHYAESSNFTLESGRVNWNDEAIPDPSGATEEKGFSVSTLEGKLHLRVNWFETSVNTRTSAPSNLAWNLIYQNASQYAKAAHTTNNATYKAFNLAVANALLDGTTDGENRVHGTEKLFNSAGEITNVLYQSIKGPKDTDDVVSKGTEFELTVNPTKNWRMHINVARQETVKTNIHPETDALLAMRLAHLDQPVPGFEWLRLGDVKRGPGNPNNWLIDPAAKAYNDPKNANNSYTNPDAGYTSFDDFLETRMTNYRTAKASEGTASPEQREWRVNLVTNYSFKEGRAKGLQVGGAYRWQDEVSIGYPLIADPVTGLTVGDIANPVMGPAEDSYDLFASYQLPWMRDKGRWSVRAQVNNVFASNDDVIAVQVQPDGQTFSRVRLAPQRLWSLSSTFRW